MGPCDQEDMYHMTPIHMAAEEGCADSMRAMMYHTRNRRSSVEYLAQRHGHFATCLRCHVALPLTLSDA